MRSNHGPALAAVLAHEGGYVSDPQDPGGATNKGVTQAVYDAWRADHQLALQSVKCITAAEVMNLYQRRYWNPVCGDQLPAGLDYCLFDFAVNSGTRRAARFLQSALGVVADGAIGPATLAAVGRVPATVLIDRVCDRRLAFLRKLKTFSHFGKGWTRRVAEVRFTAKEMAL